MIGLCWTSPWTLITPVTENDPSAFLLVYLQSILEIASSQVSASTVVWAKTAGPQTIVKAATIEAAAKRVCGAIAGSPSRKVHFNQCAYSVVGCIASASALPAQRGAVQLHAAGSRPRFGADGPLHLSRRAPIERDEMGSPLTANPICRPFGLKLLDMACNVAAFNLPRRVGQLFGVGLYSREAAHAPAFLRPVGQALSR